MRSECPTSPTATIERGLTVAMASRVSVSMEEKPKNFASSRTPIKKNKGRLEGVAMEIFEGSAFSENSKPKTKPFSSSFRFVSLYLFSKSIIILKIKKTVL